MNNDTLEFIKAFKLPNVELWQYKDNEHSLTAKGPLEVLFCKDLHLTLFKLHHFKYALDRTLKVIASSDNDKQFRSYLLPAGDGCYMLRLQVPSSTPSATNFETIIENSCQLVRNPDLETQFQSYKDKKSGIFHKGENLIKESFIRSSSLVSKGIDAVIHRGHKDNLNQDLVRKIEEIVEADKEKSGFETFTRNEAIEIMEASNEFSKRQEGGFWNRFGESSEETSGTEQADASKATESSVEEKTRFQKLNEQGHALFDKAKETLSHLTHKNEIVEETEEYRESIGKVLKREDQLTDLSDMPSWKFVQEEGKKGLVDRAKETLGHLTYKITGHGGIKEEDKAFLRSDNFIDVGEMPYLPVDEKGPLDKLAETGQDLIEAAKDGLEAVVSIIPGTGENTNEEAEKKEEEIKDKVEEVQQEKTPLVEQAKDFVGQASQKLEESRNDGDLSSETVIQPNKEGSSLIDKVNEQYSKIADKVVEIVGVKAGEGESLTDKLKEKASDIKERISNNEGEGFKETKNGFSETVEELRQGRGEGEFRKQLHSRNLFENFAGEEEDLEESDKLDEKAKGSLSAATNKIGEKLTEAKEKIKSVIGQPDKENAPTATA